MPLPIKVSAPDGAGFWEIPVLYEDDHLLALDKPAGIATSPHPQEPGRPCLIRLFHEAITAGKPWAASRGLTYLMNVHRLDEETTGVLLLAKHRSALVSLANQFGSNQSRQTWLAIVRGAPPQPQLEINARLAADPRRPGLISVSPHGQPARTVVAVAESFAGVSLLRCQLFTSRTHQLRVHLRHVRLPVFGDRLYACHALLLSNLKRDYRLKPGRTEKPLVDRAAVHVEKLEITHPATSAPLSLSAPLPRDFQVALKYLRRYAPAGATPEPVGEREN